MMMGDDDDEDDDEDGDEDGDDDVDDDEPAQDLFWGVSPRLHPWAFNNGEGEGERRPPYSFACTKMF